MDVLTLIGTGASLLGAAIAIWHACRAKKSANKAEKIRLQLIDQREASELSQLLAVCNKALRSMEKYGPASVPARLMGASHANDAVIPPKNQGAQK